MVTVTHPSPQLQPALAVVAALSRSGFLQMNCLELPHATSSHSPAGVMDTQSCTAVSSVPLSAVSAVCPHLVAVRAPVVGMVLPPVDEAPAAAVAPAPAPLRADVVAAEPRVLHAACQPHLHSIHGISHAIHYVCIDIFMYV